MTELTDDLRQRIEATAQKVQAMEGQLRSIQADVHKLPFLARGFVERDISSSTGRSLGEWAAASQRMHQALSNVVQTGAGGLGGLKSAIATELPKLGVLRAYLAKAPDKVGAVPAAVLKPQQRGRFLELVQAQVTQIVALEGDLGAIAQSIQAA